MNVTAGADLSEESLFDANLNAALALARGGAFIFPCRSAGIKQKNPCPGVYWRHASTRDEKKIRNWWVQFPGAIPGIDLGKSGLLVIDCDRKPGRPDGVVALENLAAKHQSDLLSVPIVDTPSTGRHYYFKQDFTPPHGNGRGNMPGGIDVRGHGGYVIGPGSTFTDGTGGYDAFGDIFSAGPMPDWLRAILAQQRYEPLPIEFTVPPAPTGSAYGDTALREEAARVASASEGTRNDTLNAATHSLAQLVPHILSHGEVEQAMTGAALSAGLNPVEIRKTIRSAMVAGMKKPRGPSEAPHVQIMLGRTDSAPDHDPETGEIHDDVPAPSLPAPGGLVQDIADWITSTAIYPQPALSMGAALTIVGTAAGRHMAGPTRSGTHLYVIGLAKSGAGKDRPMRAIPQILSAAGLRAHIGPDQFISMPAVINFLCRAPLSVCAIDEMGSFLKRINGRRASGFEAAISGMLRSAWGASFAAMATPEWAARSSEVIYSPSMSIYGVSTPREFYESMEGGDITNGVLNRFLVIEASARPDEQSPVDPSIVPDRIISGLKSIYYRDQMAAAQLCTSKISPDYFTLKISDGAESVRRAFVADINARADADHGMEPFLARTAENAIRLATIAAIGNGRAMVTESDMEFGAAWSMHCTETLAHGAGLYIADSDNQAAANAVRRAIRESGGRVKRRELLQKLKHRYKSRELEDVIKSLAEAEDILIEKMIPPTGGPPTYWYSVLS